jgi:hypothetical protein
VGVVRDDSGWGGFTLPQVTVLYKEAAWLTLQMLSGKNNATQIGYISYAIWYLFDPNGTTGNHTGVIQYLGAHNPILSNLQSWVTEAQNYYGSLTASQLGEFTIYSPLVAPYQAVARHRNSSWCLRATRLQMYLLLTGVLCLGAMFFPRRRLTSEPRA